jgi:hypothetical protein
VNRIVRIGNNGAAVVSALLCLALIGFWVRSQFAFDLFAVTWGPKTDIRIASVGFSRGYLWLQWTHDRFGVTAGTTLLQGHRARPPVDLPKVAQAYRNHKTLAGAYWGDNVIYGVSVHFAFIPLWLVLLFFGVRPAWWLIQRRSRRGSANAAEDSAPHFLDARTTPDLHDR